MDFGAFHGIDPNQLTRNCIRMDQLSDRSSPTSWPWKILVGWLALGVSVQISFVLLPIGNYPTLVYWLFYAPCLILLLWQRRAFIVLIRSADLALVVMFFSLLVWITLTTLWPNAGTGMENPFLQSLKHALLIVLYSMGVGFLAYQAPGILIVVLVTSTIVVALTGLVSAIDQFVLHNLPISSRLSTVGIGNWKDALNPVVAGVYFGTFAVLAGGFILYDVDRLLPRATLALCFVLCLAAMLLTGTRTALVGFLGAGLSYLIIQRKLWTTATLGLACVLISIQGIFFESGYLHDYLARGGIGSWRPEIWLASLRESLNHFLIGSGMWRDFQLTAIRGEANSVQPHSHSFYLQLLNWTGIVGLGLYMALLGRTSVLGHRRRDQPLAMAAFLALVYFMVVQIFDVYDIFTAPSYYWPCVWLPIGIVVGVSARRSRQAGDMKHEVPGGATAPMEPGEV